MKRRWTTAVFVIAMLAPAYLAAQSPRHVIYAYDPITDIGNIRMDTTTIGHNLTISGRESFRGRTPTGSSDSVLVVIRSTFRTWRFLDLRQVLLLLDDTTRVELCDPDHDGVVATGYVVELLTCNVSVKTIGRVAQAGTVVGRVGTEDIAIGSYERGILEEFLDVLRSGTVPMQADGAPYLAAEVDTAAIVDVMRDPSPRYPRSLKERSGTVVVEFVVGADGKPVNTTAHAVRSDDEAFTESAMAIIPKLRYQAAVKDGKHVAQWVRRQFVFFPGMGG